MRWSPSRGTRAPGVRLQLERFRGSGRVSDAYLLVIALRNVLRAARLAREELITDAGRAALDQAITAFEETLPGVQSARDVLEHFDEYARGRGGPGKERTLGPYPSPSLGAGTGTRAAGRSAWCSASAHIRLT